MRRFLVSGRVQGVFFRASTVEQGRALGLRGFARNLADGRVEVVAAGDDAALQALELWLRRGPPLASVASVQAGDIEPDADLPQGFEVAR
jgi:acylphosphatase